MWLGARSFQIFAILFTINGLPARYKIPRSPYDVISELMETAASPNPLIVYLNPTDQADIFYDEQEQPVQSIEDDEHFNFDHNSAKLQSANSLFNALIANFRNPLRDADSNVLEIRKEKEIMISNALRSRCEAIVKCEEKCGKTEKKSNACSDSNSNFCNEDSAPTTPKPYCPKSCKAVFDHLINCPPPGNKKKKEQKKKEQKRKEKKKKGCATGKTLPPSWKKVYRY
ncbi:uncharacterized protein LOC111358069 isoform X2 [Spodoptera litura]|uniref:Uncharacterized protein LOC111358069 isoform X2 n=1 Tax=Spodoptera litura TaxID=69820 RepID=A0A9J7EDC5_SPOLT|nr:uncharacterized protein LOC111358069 isoform X2 [Spodoptera litura]